MKASAKLNVKYGGRFRSKRRAFTLIELLVVIALTSILLTVVFKPLVNSIALTAKANTQGQSQATARDTIAQVATILSGADYVIDNSQNSQAQQTVLNLWVPDSSGNQYPIQSQFTMLEYVMPARQLDQSPFIAGGAQLPIDPTTKAPSYNFPGVTSGESGLAFPLAPGSTLGRIFLGLTNNASGPGGTFNGVVTDGAPRVPYFNYYEYTDTDPSSKPLGNFTLDKHNPYTLYNAQVQTFIQDPTVPPPTISYIPNLMLFHTGTSLATATDVKTAPVILHDPNFFYDYSLAGGNEAGAGTKMWAVPGWKDLVGDGKVRIFENWRAIASSLARTDKVDMLAYQRDPVTNGILYNGLTYYTATPPPAGSLPTVTPLAVFKPAFVQNDPAVPTNVNDSGNEVPNPIPPSFASQYDHWTSSYRVFVYRNTGSGKDPTQNNPLDYYEGVTDPNSGMFRIVHVTPAMNISPGMAGPDPATLPDVSPQINLQGVFANTDLNNPGTPPIFGFSVSSDKGLVSCAYQSVAVIHSPTAPFAPLSQRFSPDDVNTMAAGIGPRFLSLAAPLSTNAWQGNPLNPGTVIPPLNPGSNIATTSLVPGSELVFGPDQRPGLHYGSRIQYTRVPFNSTVGLNQYKINYVNNPNNPGVTNPSLFAGYIEFDSAPDGAIYNAGTLEGGGSGIDVSTGLPASGTNMLPIFKVNPANMKVDGTLEADPVEVYYNFQMNQLGDVMKIDYLTRDLMIFSLELRLYDQSSGQPQITRLTDKIRVRNLQH